MHDFQEGYINSPVDGTRIWYRYYNKGKGIPIVASNGIACDTSYWRYIVADFKETNPILIWDYRGHGHSDFPEDYKKSSLDILAKDLNEIVETIKLEKFVLTGHSMGVQVNYEYYKYFPKKVIGLIPVLGTYGKAFKTFFDSDIMERIFPALYSFLTNFGNKSVALLRPVFRTTFPYYVGLAMKSVNPCMATKEDMQPYFDHMGTMDFKFFGEMLNNLKDHDAEFLLPQIKEPVLIIAGENDTFTPLWLSQKMRDLLPDAELVVLKKGSHAALVEQPDYISCMIRNYLEKRVAPTLKTQKTVKKKSSNRNPVNKKNVSQGKKQ